MKTTEVHRMQAAITGAACGCDEGGGAQDEGQAVDNTRSLSVSDSPCVALCSTLYDDICRGCGRTAMEVANWVFLDEAEKRNIWERITEQGYPRRKKG